MLQSTVEHSPPSKLPVSLRLNQPSIIMSISILSREGFKFEIGDLNLDAVLRNGVCVKKSKKGILKSGRLFCSILNWDMSIRRLHYCAELIGRRPCTFHNSSHHR